jgi:hypothetical protein
MFNGLVPSRGNMAPCSAGALRTALIPFLNYPCRCSFALPCGGTVCGFAPETNPLDLEME